MAIYAQKKGLSGKVVGVMFGGVALIAASAMIYINFTRLNS